MSPNIIRELDPSELNAAARVLANGMRDNPLHVRVWGSDAARREAGLAAFFSGVLAQFQPKGTVFGAHRGAELVGVLAMVAPGRCKPTAGEVLRILPGLIVSAGPAAALRLKRWTDAWGRHDPAAPHWHLGPVGVSAAAQGQGIGWALMARFCETMDGENALAYLETDKEINVGFYKKFGFVTVGEGRVLDVPNWFMERPPKARGG
jgi:ribosomal protein S18 acetylase RimI-like enzyme